MQIPAEWLREAGVQTFAPKASSFRCPESHDLIALAYIEPVIRTVPLDCNGFAHDRMIRILVGSSVARFPPIPIERTEHGAHLYRLRDGTVLFAQRDGLAVGGFTRACIVE